MRYLFVLLTTLYSSQIFAEPIQVALTFDDLPYVWDTPPTGYSNKKLIQDLINTLAKHKISGAFAFVNGGKTSDPASKEILDLWAESGHFFGNHTLNHGDLNLISSTEYISEIATNEEFLRFYGRAFFKYFRYPFLHEGNTQEKRSSIRNYLFSAGCRISQVTIDHNDW